MKHCFAGFCFAFLLSPNNVWSLIYLPFTINFTLSFVTFYYWSTIKAWICVTSAQRNKYCYMFCTLVLLQGPHRCSAFTSMVLRCVLVFYFAYIQVNIYIFLHLHTILFFFNVRLFDIRVEWSNEDSTVTITDQFSQSGARTPPREYNAWWSQETLSVYQLYSK